MRRSQTVSSPSGPDKKKVRRSAVPEQEFNDITADDLNSASRALEGTRTESDANGSNIKRKRSKRGNMSAGGKDDQFYDTLKKGTVRLAATLLEEQELVLEMAEIDVLTVEERHAVEDKVAKKISESKSLRDNSRKQRQVQRTQTSNFTRLRDTKSHKRSVSSEKPLTNSDEDGIKRPKKVKKTPSSIGEPSSGTSTPAVPSPSPSPSPSLHIDSETSSAVDIENDPAIAQFEEELDRELSLEDDNPLVQASDSSDSDSDSPDFELLHAAIPPPLSISDSRYVSGDAAWAGEHEPEGSEEERVVEAIMEGDMLHFQQYLGSMKRKKRLERSASKKKILSRMSVNLGSSSATSSAPPV